MITLSHTSEQGGDDTRAEALASKNSVAAPSPAAATIVQCAACRRWKHSATEWRDHSPQITIPWTISHGICPDCAMRDRSQGYRLAAQQLGAARVLRNMIQGNLDMAARLIRIGDAGMALGELNQATAKIDQFLKALE